MKNVIVLLAVGFAIFASTSYVSYISAQSASPSSTATVTVSPAATPGQAATKRERRQQRESSSNADVGQSSTVNEKDWYTELLFPLGRLLGVAIIIGILLRWMRLPELLSRETWSNSNCSDLSF
jgi:hypothetical protein